MIDKAVVDGILNELKKNGNTNPSALGSLGQLLANNIVLTVQMASFLAAKQELAEMKRELGKLQVCVQQLEGYIDQYGPGLSRQSNVNKALVNWMISFAESYYGLAVALGARDSMLPGVLGFLNGRHVPSGTHVKSGGFLNLSDVDLRVLSQVLSQAQTPLAQTVKEAVASTMKNPPGFLKP